MLNRKHVVKFAVIYFNGINKIDDSEKLVSTLETALFVSRQINGASPLQPKTTVWTDSSALDNAVKHAQADQSYNGSRKSRASARHEKLYLMELASMVDICRDKLSDSARGHSIYFLAKFKESPRILQRHISRKTFESDQDWKQRDKIEVFW